MELAVNRLPQIGPVEEKGEEREQMFSIGKDIQQVENKNAYIP